MKAIVLKYGLISGGIMAAMLIVTSPLYEAGLLDLATGEVAGFASMVLAFLLVFFGVRSYRDRTGGAISFGRAFTVGITIVLIASLVYVVTWEIMYFGFGGDEFIDQYSAMAIEKMIEAGESQASIEARRAEMASFAEMYDNPLVNVGITFLEVLPVGLVMTLVSAGILRRRDVSGRAPA